MNINEGKVVHSSYADAEKVVEQMRRKNNENYTIYKSSGGWMIGGVHMKPNRKKKRINSLVDLKELLGNIDYPTLDEDIQDYYETISKEESSEKISEENGSDTRWILEAVEVLRGTELGMSNNKNYLTLSLKNTLGTRLRLKMGGAFEKSIPLVEQQARSLRGNAIIWHTWNSKYTAKKLWSSESWFYMIEENKA